MNKPHPYIPNSVPELKKKMMQELGILNIDELYSDVPEEVKLRRALDVPGPMTEYELFRHVDGLLSRNRNIWNMPIFLGAGCWPHYVPAAVMEVVSRTEFLTSYTPYQPEISQGMLQALYEYQSMICELTGMDVANCSMYDWATALGEAARMAARFTRRVEVVVPRIIHPERLSTLNSYTEPAGIRVKQVGYHRDSGQLDLEELKEAVSGDTAAVYVENPSYLGFLETQVREVGEIAHDAGALFIVGVDPTSLGVVKPPGEYGADIVVGEGQPLGSPMNFGGPLLGIFACRWDAKLVRQMPGRIIGLTTTKDGSQRGFCMALSTREQHIRREKATSNICTNEALCAVTAAVYMALLGPEGFRELGETILYRSHYAMKRLNEIEGVTAPLFKAPHFKEFVVNFDGAGMKVEDVHRRLLEAGVHGGKPITGEFPELGESALYCVTEIHTKEDIDRLAEALKGALAGGR